ncbi:MAG: hypothetical protein CBC13_01155 [Planctomycetia bacterium TMED53]|nr:MAG: hypothetical protein CBC13_01155 [Planctomycetia bacterium TMED53]
MQDSPQLLEMLLHGLVALLPGLFMASVGLVRWGIVLTGLIIGLDPMWIGWPVALGNNGETIYFGLLATFAAFTFLPPLRAQILSRPAMNIVRSILPPISDTEKEALEGGTVGWDGEIFSGTPNWHDYLGQGTYELSAREQEFIDGPLAELVNMVDTWQDRQNGTISEEAFQYLSDHGFFGMIIPEEYGGLGFSATAISTVISKAATVSNALAVTIMVPNSLGPGELLLHYGTTEQKKRLLPRLAKGLEIPCFALTEPGAGSDAAGSMSSHGIVVEEEIDGEKVLGLRLNWEKRYITLAPRASLVGVAFRLYDPDHLLGDQEDLGITCALVPAETPGVETGERHDPLGVPFLNGPTRGRDVVVPLDTVIGGRAGCGKGWTMLMQCLSAGRGIMLPSSSTGGAQLSLRVAAAHASVREQFGLPVGRFEGVQEPLVRSAVNVYALDALRLSTTLAVDSGEKPAVISAVAKAYATETLRKVVNDCMDVVAGNAICRGPRNELANAYAAVPVGITVEGANILTRTLIIFGQGAVRCHPFVQKELAAVENNDLKAFDQAFWGHVGFVVSKATQTLLQRLTGARLGPRNFAGSIGRSHQRLTALSSAFALCTDAAMGTLGGTLKRKEHLTGRLADALTWMVVGSAALKKFQDDGRPRRDQELVDYLLQICVRETEAAMGGFLDNLPLRPAAWGLRLIGVPGGARSNGPSDQLSAKISAKLLDSGELWHSLTDSVMRRPTSSPGLWSLENALEKVVAAQPDRDALKQAIRRGDLKKGPLPGLVEKGLEKGIIDAEGALRIHSAEQARQEAITVDHFANGEIPANSNNITNRDTVQKRKDA